MANETRVFKVQSDRHYNCMFTEVAETDTSVDQYPDVLIFANSWGDPPTMYRKETSMMEKIIKVKREETEDAKRRFKIAHTKSKFIKKETVKLHFNYAPYSAPEDEIFAEFQMEYVLPDKISKALSGNYTHFKDNENITITTENSGDITVNTADINRVPNYASAKEPYKFKVSLNKNILDLMMYSRAFSYDHGLHCENGLNIIRCNLDTGLIYSSTDETLPLSDMKNATTGPAGERMFSYLTDDIVDVLLEMTKCYMNDKYGIETKVYKTEKAVDTFKGYVFNPLCNVMYLYKPFFNTRFRTYFKRDDVSTNHFETLCTMLGLPYDEKLLALSAQNYRDLFLAKCIYDAGIKNVDNVVNIVNAAVNCNWMRSSIREFVRKYYGDQTDYLLTNTDYCKEYRFALCVYIKKALTYVDENAFTEMFVRSVAQHSKYWNRSLIQVATLIGLDDYNRELMRKACSYGLNKIQSDAIDLAYDKLITKNKYIRYNPDEMAMEESIGDIYFKRPIDMFEISDFLLDMGFENKELPLLAARKINNVMFVKDDRGEKLACLVTRNNDLCKVYISKRSLRHSTDDIKNVCSDYITKHKIRQYFCDTLKESKTKKSMSFLPLPF